MKKILFIILFSLPLFVYSQDSLVIGEYIIKKILDGDTFRFEGLDKSTRLLGVDTEETFKDADAEMKVNDISSYWTEYYAHKRDSSQKPAKTESPFGYDTWQWTKKIFRDVVKVRLEVDEFKRVEDIFGRYLVYVIAIREDGSEFNYNIECVKQGYSPYFSKYGYVKRFHKEFQQAQEYAMSHKLGIWSGKELCYPDYNERRVWWERRAEQIKSYETELAGMPGYYSMLDVSDFKKLKKHLNDTVVVFGIVNSVYMDKNPYKAKLEINDNDFIELVFFEENQHIIKDHDLTNPKDYYIYVKGLLTDYKGNMQIIIDDVSQIWSN